MFVDACRMEAITGATTEQAQFFLQSANGDLEVRRSSSDIDGPSWLMNRCRLPCRHSMNLEG